MVFANAAVCADARIGRCCIVNTAASVDHECVIGEGSSIGPGARLAGLVRVGKFADIYTGAVILPRIRIGEGAVVGAGAVVLKDVEPYTVVAGNPAEIIKRGERK
jgi:acetyltransferase-like isoleucine patch superfamily enzyme